MLDDNAFGILVVVFGAMVLINKALTEYGFDRAISDMRNLLILLVVVIVLGFIFFMLIRANAERIKDLFKSKPIVVTKEIIVEKPAIKIDKDIPEPLLPKPEKIIEDINITIDEDKRFFWFSKLDKHEVEYLKEYDYIIRTFVNPFKKKKEKFMFKPYSNEGDMHAFMVLLIAHYLKNKVENMNLYVTVKITLIQS